jgi:hypothetical protein
VLLAAAIVLAALLALLVGIKVDLWDRLLGVVLPVVPALLLLV